tara:strand:- start:364 stop:501 length:138 start_codon:yes stop_codon:yes gene_type:complete
MSIHKLTDDEKFHIRTTEEVKRWEKVYELIEDIENRLTTLETKIK